MKPFALPDLGEGLQEAEIVAWHVSAGDHVVADQPLVSVETEKAVVEIPAPWSGRIARLHGQPGDRDSRSGRRWSNTKKQPQPMPALSSATCRRARRSRRPPAARRRASGAASGYKATPAVRALARKLGVDLGAVAPSGADGLITKADVERAGSRPDRGRPAGALARRAPRHGREHDAVPRRGRSGHIDGRGRRGGLAGRAAM